MSFLSGQYEGVGIVGPRALDVPNDTRAVNQSVSQWRQGRDLVTLSLCTMSAALLHVPMDVPMRQHSVTGA